MAYPSVRYGLSPGTPSGSDPRRKQQVDELLAKVPSCRPVNPDRTLLEVPVQTRNGRLIAVQISLPQRFPDDPPVLSVGQPIRHPALDGNGRLRLAALQFWRPGHRLVDVVREAQTTLVGQTSPSGPANTTHHQPNRLSNVNSFAPSQITAELQTLSEEDLGNCLTDAATYKKLVRKLINASQVSCVNEELRKSNLDVAQSNLDLENAMREIGNQIAIIKSSEYADARGLYQEQVQRQQEVVSRLSIPVLREQLQEATKKVDEESEELDRRFMSGELAVDTFVEEFCRLRKIYYTRELKAQAAAQLQ